MRHYPHFDWVVAYVGGCFPETVIERVLNVGLKDFCQSAETQVKKDANFSLSRVPKVNSVVGILGHLASSHSAHLRASMARMVDDSLAEPAKTMSDQSVGTVPYLMYLVRKRTRTCTQCTIFIHIRAIYRLSHFYID